MGQKQNKTLNESKEQMIGGKNEIGEMGVKREVERDKR